MSSDQNHATTVWIANEAGHPYHKVADAVKGEVIIRSLTVGKVNPLRPDRLAWDMAQGIAKFVKPRDILLISGSPVVNAMAMTLWIQMHSTVRLALWDAVKREYRLATVEKDNLERILQNHLES